MLTKDVLIDKIEVVENGAVQVRQTTRVMENGVELSKSYHRWVLTPGMNTDNQEPRVQAICNAVWTPEVIAAFEASRQQQLNAIREQQAA
jgi:hypothetical protein